MKTITGTELKNILAEHKIWLETGAKQGTRANLEGANLRDADLTDAYLTDADLTDADLTDADLTGANLTGTILDEKAEKKEEKQPEVSPCKVANIAGTRQALEKLAKEHGMKIDSISLSFI